MPILVECPSCHRQLRVQDELVGRRVKCPSCGTAFPAASVGGPQGASRAPTPAPQPVAPPPSPLESPPPPPPQEERVEPRLTTDWAAFLPEDYVPDNEEKLELYRRLAVASRPDVIDSIGEELADRFGAVPLPARHLLELRRIRLLGSAARASEMKLDHARFEVWLRTPLTPKQAHTVLTRTKEDLEFLSGKEMGVRLKRAGGEASRHC